MKHLSRILLFSAVLAPAIFGQLRLFVVANGSEQPAPAAIYDLGKIEPSLATSTTFRLRNTGAVSTVVDLLSVSGAGFRIGSAPHIPLTLPPLQSFDFEVLFQSDLPGSYSASLDTNGVSILLTASIGTELTATLDGVRPLGAAPVDFGTVATDSASTHRVTLTNKTGVPVAVPPIGISGPGFSVKPPSPAGVFLSPAESATLDLLLSPIGAGVTNGVLTIGTRTYSLTGVGSIPPLPAPKLSVALTQQASANQGAITVNLSSPSRTTGSGTVTLAFTPATSQYQDSTVVFADGTKSASFQVAIGDSQAQFPSGATALFQTGTTAGTLLITAQLAGEVDQETIVIAPATVGITAAQAVRAAASVEIDLTGFDNTRSAGALAFTFYDASGTAVSPGTIRADSASAFAQYFQTASDGTFALRAVFPISGDPAQIKSFEATITNAQGDTATPRTKF